MATKSGSAQPRVCCGADNKRRGASDEAGPNFPLVDQRRRLRISKEGGKIIISWRSPYEIAFAADDDAAATECVSNNAARLSDRNH